MVGGKSLQPSHILVVFRLPVCLLNTLCPRGLSGLLDPHVTDEASLGVWKQGHWQIKLKKKKTFRVKVQSPSSWLEETRSCKQTFPVLSVLCSRWSCPSYHSCTHTPSPAQLSCSLGLFSSKGLVGALMWSGGPWKPLRAEKDVFRGNREKH